MSQTVSEILRVISLHLPFFHINLFLEKRQSYWWYRWLIGSALSVLPFPAIFFFFYLLPPISQFFHLHLSDPCLLLTK